MNTTIVARIGTSTSGSSQALTQRGNSLSPSALPGSGAIVPITITFFTFVMVSGTSYDANDNDSNYDDQYRGDNWHDEIKVR